jgi:hypothetical protein
MALLDTLINVGRIRTDNFGRVKYPNFTLLLRIAKESNLDYKKALAFIEITPDTPIRVKESTFNSLCFLMKINGEWQEIDQQNDVLSNYKDLNHKQVRGAGFVEWINSDFEQPFTPEIILSALGWDRIVKALGDRDLQKITPRDELSFCQL